MPQVVMEDSIVKIKVTPAEFAVLVGDKAKEAGILPSSFNVTRVDIVPSADGNYDITYHEEIFPS